MDKEKIIETLYNELARKDKIISNLKEENKVLVQVALKSAKKRSLLPEVKEPLDRDI